MQLQIKIDLSAFYKADMPRKLLPFIFMAHEKSKYEKKKYNDFEALISSQTTNHFCLVGWLANRLTNYQLVCLEDVLVWRSLLAIRREDKKIVLKGRQKKHTQNNNFCCCQTFVFFSTVFQFAEEKLDKKIQKCHEPFHVIATVPLKKDFSFYIHSDSITPKVVQHYALRGP